VVEWVVWVWVVDSTVAVEATEAAAAGIAECNNEKELSRNMP
jgi:hypothetical protein